MKLLCLTALVCALLSACQVVRVQPGPNALQNGMNAAGDGGVVVLEPGNYGDQTLSNTNRPKGTLFAAEDGAVLRSLNARLDRAMFDNFNVDAVASKRLAVDLSGNNLVFQDSRVGNVVDEKGMIASGSDITIRNTTFHDVWLQDPNVHSECLYAIGVPRIKLQNNTFFNCATMDVMFTYGSWWTPPPPGYGDGVVEGNSFDAPRFVGGECCHYYAVLWNAALPYVRGWTVRNNRFSSVENPPTPGKGDISLEGQPYEQGVRCGNTGPIGVEWKQPC